MHLNARLNGEQIEQLNALFVGERDRIQNDPRFSESLKGMVAGIPLLSRGDAKVGDGS